LHVFLGPVLEQYFSRETVAFALGSGDSLLSDLSGRFVCWLAFYAAIRVFYRTAAPGISGYAARKYPKAPTSTVSQKLVENMIEVSEHAFPLYVTVPVITDFFKVKGWSMACDSVEDCGGLVWSALGCLLYFLALEVVIFCDPYYFLHKWKLGMLCGQHAYHHVYKFGDQLNAFSAYAFAPQDGWSQGMALPLCTLFVPVPIAFVYLMEACTGLWTFYIHTDIAPLPWPFMGCDYHYIHHRYNWYNFGFMTIMMDSLAGTIRHPNSDALAVSRGERPMPDSEKKRSAELSQAILEKRGANGLQKDDAAGDEGRRSRAVREAAIW
jgi:lathosterol oxidase